MAEDKTHLDYSLWIEGKIAYAKHFSNPKLDYEIKCIDSDMQRIRVEALYFNDKIKMEVKNIDNFDLEAIQDILPECFV